MLGAFLLLLGLAIILLSHTLDNIGEPKTFWQYILTCCFVICITVSIIVATYIDLALPSRKSYIQAKDKVEDLQTKLACMEKCFGEVEVRAYTVNDCTLWADGHTATGYEIQKNDYIVAVSVDIEKWMGGISNNKGMHVPGYNKKGELSKINDRSVIGTDRLGTIRSVEVLMTAGKARDRALVWGVKKGILYGTKAGDTWVYYVTFEK